VLRVWRTSLISLVLVPCTSVRSTSYPSRQAAAAKCVAATAGTNHSCEPDEPQLRARRAAPQQLISGTPLSTPELQAFTPETGWPESAAADNEPVCAHFVYLVLDAQYADDARWGRVFCTAAETFVCGTPREWLRSVAYQASQAASTEQAKDGEHRRSVCCPE
jgi:hypothetical protein